MILVTTNEGSVIYVRSGHLVEVENGILFVQNVNLKVLAAFAVGGWKHFINEDRPDAKA